MIKNIILSLILLTTSLGQEKLTKYVDPFIGTGGHAHTFPGATLPFGMVQLSPDTDNKGWDWCSGYHYSDNSIMGFSHTHLSGTGATDYGDILFMPFNGETKLIPGTKNNPDEGYRSRFSHNNEKASPGFYSVFLSDHKINVELTVTERTGFHKYTFNSNKNKKIIIDLEHGISDKTIESKIELVNLNTISGFRRSKGWASDHTIYFYVEFSEKIKNIFISDKNKNISEKSYTGNIVKGVLVFNDESKKEIYVKIGISHVSIEGARNNLIKENPNWDFDKIKLLAQNKWEKELNRIKVKTTQEDLLTKFYTAFYHSMIAPNIYSDNNGDYTGMDRKTHNSNQTQYTVFSLWDTYRALHPLLTITDSKRTEEFVNSILTKYDNFNLLPVWELAGNETNCMIGYHAVPVLLDSYVKGIGNIDIHKILKSVKSSGEQNIRSTDIYRNYGMIPSEIDNEGVSKTLEYAYDDWCISEIAKLAGDKKTSELYFERSKNYINYFDSETKFMRPKRNGKWIDNFNPSAVTTDFTEANSWQYTFSVQHDIPGLIDLYNGKKGISKKLDELFFTNSKLDGRHQPDITGLIGQYAHGNEPSHHVAYLYNYLNESWKTQEKVRMICDSLYKVGPEGLSGNDDCGQLSAWYVFSTIGFYPVTPGSDKYIIGSPVFDEVEILLDNGKVCKIITQNNSKINKYIQSVYLNNKVYNKPFFTHKDLMKGSEIKFLMASTPNKNWGNDNDDLLKKKKIKKLPQPVLAKGEILFEDETMIKIDPIVKESNVYYTLDGSEPTIESEKYLNPFYIKEKCVLKFKSFKDGFKPGSTNQIQFNKIKNNWKIDLRSDYHSSYPGGGESTLIDGIRGGKNFRTGSWQGYEGKDFEAVIDLGEITEINKLGAGFYQDIGVWIFMPKKIKFYTSIDNKNFNETAVINNDVILNKNGVIIKDLFSKIKSVKARYVKVIVESQKVCPDWHSGSGLNCFIFIDEIIIE